MQPDFLITPYQVKADSKLRPTDGDIYAVVYWFEHLRDGRCTAGNNTIAEVLNITDRAVRAGLERLEKQGYIQRFYMDPERQIRTEIRTLVRFAKIPPSGPVIKTPKEQRTETAGQYASRFFTEDKARMELLEELLQRSPGISKEALIAEMKNFIIYWTEPNKSSTKQRWQLQQTFDVRRRLYTWLNNAGKYNQKKSGAGTII